MKKLSIYASTLLLSSTLLQADINIQLGWQLLGAVDNVNVSKFNDTCVDYIWKYNTIDTITPEWNVYIANGVTYNHSYTEIASLNSGEGFWVKGNDTCSIIETPPSTPAEDNTTTETNATAITHNGVIYDTIVSAETNRIWLDRNLGASQVCTVFDDTACYGDYYQWGRDTDGHEKSDSAMTSTLATTITAANGNFIQTSSPHDWTTADLDGALRSVKWSKIDGSSICPVGYRVPTLDEFELELAVISNQNDAFTTLKLPSSGYRNIGDGAWQSG